MRIKIIQRLNLLHLLKGFPASAMLVVIIAEVFLCFIQSTCALWSYRGRSAASNSRSHIAHGDCEEGYCAKKWNCHSPVTPTLYCGRWGSRRWVCCSDKTGREVKQNLPRTTLPEPPTRPSINVAPTRPSVSVAGCGIRANVPRATNITGRSADPKTEFIIFDPGVNSRRVGSDAIPLPDAVVGGREVDPYSWPWMSAIRKETVPGIHRFVCAGSLINHRYVLTAAHVFTPADIRTPTMFLVVLGSHFTSEGIAIGVESIEVNPSYRPRLYYHDIALLRLDRDVTFDTFIRPICLPMRDTEESELVGTEVTVIGWGDDAFGGVSSPVLREASFPIVSREMCNNSYIRIASTTFPSGITRDMICAGAPSGGKDACQGDSGGPLAMEVGNRWVIVGIVSFGYRCGDSEYPGVYTRVSRYLEWIRESTGTIQR